MTKQEFRELLDDSEAIVKIVGKKALLINIIPTLRAIAEIGESKTKGAK